jgi:hypothetical protein
VFRIVSAAPEGGNLRVTWTTVGGKSYRVQTNAAITGSFGDLSSLISVPGIGESTTNFLHVGGVTDAPSRFYRVRLGP